MAGGSRSMALVLVSALLGGAACGAEDSAQPTSPTSSIPAAAGQPAPSNDEDEPVADQASATAEDPSTIEVRVTGDVELTFTLRGDCDIVGADQVGMAVEAAVDAANDDDSQQIFHFNPVMSSGITVVAGGGFYQSEESEIEVSGSSVTVRASAAKHIGDPSREVAVTATATDCRQS